MLSQKKPIGVMPQGWNVEKVYDDYISKLSVTASELYIHPDDDAIYRISKSAIPLTNKQNRTKISPSLRLLSMCSDGRKVYALDMDGNVLEIVPVLPIRTIRKFKSARAINYSRGSLIISAEDKIFQLDLKEDDNNNTNTPTNTPPKVLCSNITADAITVDSNNVIYLTTSSSFIYKVQNQVISIVSGDGVQGMKDGPFWDASFTCPNTVLVTSKGLVLVGNRKFLRSLDLTSKQVTTVWKSDGEILCMTEDDSGNIYVGTSDGVFCLTPPPQQGVIQKYEPLPPGTKMIALKTYKAEGLFKSTNLVKFLSFKPGDQMTVIKDKENGWINAKMKYRDEEGFVPAFCMKAKLDDSENQGTLSRVDSIKSAESSPIISKFSTPNRATVPLSPQTSAASSPIISKKTEDDSVRSKTSSATNSVSNSPSSSQPGSAANSEVFFQPSPDGSQLSYKLLENSLLHNTQTIDEQKQKINKLKLKNSQLLQRPTREEYEKLEQELSEKNKLIQELNAKIRTLEEKLQPEDSDCPEISHSELTDMKLLHKSATSPLHKAKCAGTWVAVKQFYVDEEDEDATLKELQALRSYNHSSIVNLRGKCLDPPCIVMEYMELGSLADVLHKKGAVSMPPQMKLDIAKQVAAGLQFLHQHNIVHGDISSTSVLINQCWMAKITHFASMVPGANRGTPHSPPEAFDEDTQLTASSDVYSFGILFWEILAEKKPFEGIKKGAPLIKKIAVDQARPDIKELKSIPQSAELCQACWGHEPSQRLSSEQVMKQLEKISLSQSSLIDRMDLSQFSLQQLLHKEEYWNPLQTILESSTQGWKQLGSVLGISNQVLTALETEKTPTKILIEKWMQKELATVPKFLLALEKIGQWAAIYTIIQWTQSCPPEEHA